MSQEERPLPRQFSHQLKTWWRSQLANRILWGVLSIVSIAGGLVISAFGKELGDRTRMIGFVAALSSACLVIFRVGEKADRFLLAWRGLNGAATKYRFSRAEVDDLIAAYERGEQAIGLDTEAAPRAGVNTAVTPS